MSADDDREEPAKDEPAPERERAPIADLLLGQPHWRQAAATLRGSFNRAQAERVGKAAATQMTEEFTFAF